jgi:hypothetical protein
MLHLLIKGKFGKLLRAAVHNIELLIAIYDEPDINKLKLRFPFN